MHCIASGATRSAVCHKPTRIGRAQAQEAKCGCKIPGMPHGRQARSMESVENWEQFVEYIVLARLDAAVVCGGAAAESGHVLSGQSCCLHRYKIPCGTHPSVFKCSAKLNTFQTTRRHPRYQTASSYRHVHVCARAYAGCAVCGAHQLSLHTGAVGAAVAKKVQQCNDPVDHVRITARRLQCAGCIFIHACCGCRVFAGRRMMMRCWRFVGKERAEAKVQRFLDATSHFRVRILPGLDERAARAAQFRVRCCGRMASLPALFLQHQYNVLQWPRWTRGFLCDRRRLRQHIVRARRGSGFWGSGFWGCWLWCGRFVVRVRGCRRGIVAGALRAICLPRQARQHHTFGADKCLSATFVTYSSYCSPHLTHATRPAASLRYCHATHRMCVSLAVATSCDQARLRLAGACVWQWQPAMAHPRGSCDLDAPQWRQYGTCHTILGLAHSDRRSNTCEELPQGLCFCMQERLCADRNAAAAC